MDIPFFTEELKGGARWLEGNQAAPVRGVGGPGQQHGSTQVRGHIACHPGGPRGACADVQTASASRHPAVVQPHCQEHCSIISQDARQKA